MRAGWSGAGFQRIVILDVKSDDRAGESTAFVIAVFLSATVSVCRYVSGISGRRERGERGDEPVFSPGHSRYFSSTGSASGVQRV